MHFRTAGITAGADTDASSQGLPILQSSNAEMLTPAHQELTLSKSLAVGLIS